MTSIMNIVPVLKFDIQTLEEVPIWFTKKPEEGRSAVKVVDMLALKAYTAIVMSTVSLETILIFNLVVFIKNVYK